jgi:putative ABC transport system substrate-binding protein
VPASLSYSERSSLDKLVQLFGGTKASGIPVEQVVRIELVINLKTARALGLTVPSAVMAEATKLIE